MCILNALSYTIGLQSCLFLMQISDFLDGVMRSGPMQIAFNYLSSKVSSRIDAGTTVVAMSRPLQGFEKGFDLQNLVARDPAQFKSQLYQMWFRLYTREVRDDTCG